MSTKLPNWTTGIESTLKRNDAFLPDQYSWHAIDNEGRFVFITEADHKDKNSAIINSRFQIPSASQVRLLTQSYDRPLIGLEF